MNKCKRTYLLLIQKITVINVIVALVGICLLFLATDYMHTQTYQWQCTQLGSSLRPVERDTCEYNVADETGTKSTKYKIAMLMMYDNNDGNWNTELMNRVLKNRESYCKKYDITMINANNLIDKTRPPAWSKLIAVEHHLKTGLYDYVMYIDMDVVIMDPSIPVTRFIDPKADFVMTTDWNGLNTGIWVAKNTPWTIWFLRTAWEQSQLVVKRSPEGKPYPFEYEQRAFHFLTNSQIWQQRGLPVYRGGKETPAEIYTHFHVLPQCAFNSYVLHPLDYRGDREQSQYVPGDFLVHLAGKKGQMKTDLMNHYLDRAEAGKQ